MHMAVQAKPSGFVEVFLVALDMSPLGATLRLVTSAPSCWWDFYVLSA